MPNVPFPRSVDGSIIPFGFLAAVGSSLNLAVASGGNVSSVNLNGAYQFVPNSAMYIAIGSGASAVDILLSPLEYPPRAYYVKNAPVSAYMAASSGTLQCIPLGVA